MGMANGAGTGVAVSEINITPLIDVLLVLLIIFMVIAPVPPRGLDASLPQPSKGPSIEPPDGTIVVSVVAHGNDEPTYRINQEVLLKSQIEPRLAGISALRRHGVMYVQADPSIPFSTVADIIDMGHQAQVDDIGLMAATHP